MKHYFSKSTIKTNKANKKKFRIVYCRLLIVEKGSFLINQFCNLLIHRSGC